MRAAVYGADSASQHAAVCDLPHDFGRVFVYDVFINTAEFGLKFKVCGPNSLCKFKAQI